MKRTAKWILVLFAVMAVLALAVGTAGAEVERTLQLRIPLNPLRRGGAGVTGPDVAEPVTCVPYTFTVDNGTDTDVVSYIYKIAVFEDDSGYGDTVYQSLQTAEPTFTYTFYLPGSYVLFVDRYDSTDNEVGNYALQCGIEISENPDEVNPLYETIDGIVSELNGESQWENALSLHDWLTNHAYYDGEYEYYGPDGVLLEGTGVCNSYARAYMLLCEKAGIPVRRVTGTATNALGGSEDHAWNAIQLDGEWYLVDVTWDDPAIEDCSAEVSGYEHHDYFCLNDDLMGLDHTNDGILFARGQCDSLAANYSLRTDDKYAMGDWTVSEGEADFYTDRVKAHLAAGETEFNISCEDTFYVLTNETDGYEFSYASAGSAKATRGWTLLGMWMSQNGFAVETGDGNESSIPVSVSYDPAKREFTCSVEQSPSLTVTPAQASVTAGTPISAAYEITGYIGDPDLISGIEINWFVERDGAQITSTRHNTVEGLTGTIGMDNPVAGGTHYASARIERTGGEAIELVDRDHTVEVTTDETDEPLSINLSWTDEQGNALDWSTDGAVSNQVITLAWAMRGGYTPYEGYLNVRRISGETNFEEMGRDGAAGTLDFTVFGDEDVELEIEYHDDHENSQTLPVTIPVSREVDPRVTATLDWADVDQETGALSTLLNRRVKMNVVKAEGVQEEIQAVRIVAGGEEYYSDMPGMDGNYHTAFAVGQEGKIGLYAMATFDGVNWVYTNTIELNVIKYGETGAFAFSADTEAEDGTIPVTRGEPITVTYGAAENATRYWIELMREIGEDEWEVCDVAAYLDDPAEGETAGTAVLETADLDAAAYEWRIRAVAEADGYTRYVTEAYDLAITELSSGIIFNVRAGENNTIATGGEIGISGFAPGAYMIEVLLDAGNEDGQSDNIWTPSFVNTIQPYWRSGTYTMIARAYYAEGEGEDWHETGFLDSEPVVIRVTADGTVDVPQAEPALPAYVDPDDYSEPEGEFSFDVAMPGDASWLEVSVEAQAPWGGIRRYFQKKMQGYEGETMHVNVPHSRLLDEEDGLGTDDVLVIRADAGVEGRNVNGWKRILPVIDMPETPEAYLTFTDTEADAWEAMVGTDVMLQVAEPADRIPGTYTCEIGDDEIIVEEEATVQSVRFFDGESLGMEEIRPSDEGGIRFPATSSDDKTVTLYAMATYTKMTEEWDELGIDPRRWYPTNTLTLEFKADARLMKPEVSLFGDTFNRSGNIIAQVTNKAEIIADLQEQLGEGAAFDPNTLGLRRRPV